MEIWKIIYYLNILKINNIIQEILQKIKLNFYINMLLLWKNNSTILTLQICDSSLFIIYQYFLHFIRFIIYIYLGMKYR